jgi:lysyl-tRNA synthetase class II
MNEFTDEHLDVLQNLEFAIVTTYKQRPEMTDYDVMRIMETLIDGYQAETIGRPPRYTPVTDVEIDLRDNLRRMCEWRLGRIQLVKDERMKELEKTDPKTLDEIVACLKKLHNSARKWNKSGGRRGYLDFVVKHIG